MATPPSWIDKDFVSRCLGNGHDVLSFEIQPATAKGDGNLGDMFRITACLQDSQVSHMIIKCSPEGDAREELVTNIDAYNKEIHMYTKILPAIQKLLEKSAIHEPLAAKCIYHGNNPIKYLVLEDLRDSGFRMAQRQKGLDLAHCSLAIKAFGRLHALSLAICEEDPTTMAQYNENPYSEASRLQVQPFVENGIKALAEAVSTWPGYEKYARKLESMKESYFDRIVEVCKRKDDDFNVLIHGDSWCNNMMFRYQGDVPEAIRLVDFQLCHYTSPVLELQYFLYSSPMDDVRVKHLDNLLHEYHTTFVDTLKVLGISRRAISLQELKNKMKERAFYALFVCISVMPIGLSDPGHFDANDSMSNDCHDKERYQNIYGNETYVKIMKRLLPIFEHNGVL